MNCRLPAAVALLGLLVPGLAAANPAPTTPYPLLFSINGQLGSITSGSTSIAGISLSPNSAGWAMPLAAGVVQIKLLGTSTGGASGPQLAVCPLGGTCACATAPDILLLGETGEYSIGTGTTTPPTVIACGGATDAIGVQAR